jgi:PAS domain-containing protein
MTYAPIPLAHSEALPWQLLAAVVATAAVAAIACARRSKARLRGEFDRSLRDQARMRMVIEQLPTIFWTTDAELNFTSCEGAGLVGLPEFPPDIVGKSFYDYFQTTDRTAPPIANHLAALAGESRNYEFAWNRRHFLVHCEPLRDPSSGAIIGVVGVGSDITSRVAAERALAQSEAKNRALLTAIPDVMFRLTADGTLVEFIDNFAAPSENCAGRNVREVFPSGVAALFLDAAAAALGGGTTQAFEYETGTPGHRRTFEARVVNCGGQEALAIVRKVTAHRPAAEVHVAPAKRQGSIRVVQTA